MIDTVKIKNVATYCDDNEEIVASKKLNFIYGNNGTGKTTISRLIENPTNASFKNCSIVYDSDGECGKLIYNQDFVKSNFNSETQLRGIYTFGEESEEKYKQIEIYKETKNEKIDKKKTLENLINEKQQKIHLLKKETNDILWDNYKKKYCDKLPEIFKGGIGTKDLFFDKCISLEYIDDKLSFDLIQDEYTLLYAKDQQEKELIKNIDVLAFKQILSSDIFCHEINENKDIKLSKVIEDMNNSSWVEEGLTYLEKSKDFCPFCQQGISKEFIENIYKIYDNKYKKDKLEFNSKSNTLKSSINEIKEIISNSADELKDTKLIVDINEYFNNIITELDAKDSNLKHICNFNNNTELLDRLKVIIDQINETIINNNEKIKNIVDSRKKLVQKGWNFIRQECNNEIDKYLSEKKVLEQELQGMLEENKNNLKTINDIDDSIKKLENSITSITRTINNINDVLNKFNYSNFRLIENSDHMTYSIVRLNGEDASKTLSEGEFSFISFLYFYNLIFGSRTRSGLQEEHILVIDDPVTSMDSNTLFIISTLIRQLMDLCIENKRNIKQIYILTHNLYFFKEVTYGYDERGRKSIKNNVAYFIVNKVNGISRITEYKNINPVKTSYELLWSKLRKKDYNDDSNLNTMRRILEQFLKSIGLGTPNNNNNHLINFFDGNDKLIVKSLLSYINDGSHSIMDGLYIANDELANEHTFNVFEQIFDKLGFSEHYKMMMNEIDD